MVFQITPQYSYNTSYKRDNSLNGDHYQTQFPSKERALTSLEDVPRYPMAYRNTGSSSYKDSDGTIFIEHHHVSEPRHQPRARFAESVELRGPERKPREKVSGGFIRSIDDEADRFIKANHKGFEFRQWKTFKM